MSLELWLEEKKNEPLLNKDLPSRWWSIVGQFLNYQIEFQGTSTNKWTKNQSKQPKVVSYDV